MDLFDDAELDNAQKMSDKKKRITELSVLISKYQKSYYGSEAEISDAEFDALWDELKMLDPENAVLHKIGSDVTNGNFQKIKHKMPMGSQEKAANPEEFLAWAIKHEYSEYLVEYKLDGASLELQYEDGLLVRAVTRGDGEVGDVITANAIKMNGVLPKLEVGGVIQHFTGGIRGEVIMTHQVHKSLFADKANCRNAANGLMKRKDGSGSEHLCVICYDAFSSDENTTLFYTDEQQKIQWLLSCGFNVVPLVVCKNATEVIDYRARVMEVRPSLDYDIDGLVIKPRTIDRDDMITRARPDKQIAFKFSLEEAVSILRKVIWSESGATYTPIGEFDTVELAGTRVQRASLVNPNTIRSLNVKIGSHIVVTKRGEIIPKIESVVKEPATITTPETNAVTTANNSDNSSVQETEIVFPTVCNVCGSTLSDEGTRLYCPNKYCSKRIHHQIEKWVSVLDIRDLGETLIKSLFQSGRLKSIHDIYSLTEEELTPFFLNEESLAKDKKSLGAAKVYKAIHSKTTIPLEIFIAGFDIEGIGEVLVRRLVQAGFDTLDKLMVASEESLAAVNGFGTITAHTLSQGLVENTEEIHFLIDNNIISIVAPITGGKLSGLSFCFTGELYSLKRSQAESIVKTLGGVTKSSVVKGLSYLVTNDASSGSSKNRKAAELGIPVIDEKAFMALVE